MKSKGIVRSNSKSKNVLAPTRIVRPMFDGDYVAPCCAEISMLRDVSSPLKIQKPGTPRPSFYRWCKLPKGR